jgi:hypothetical protein
MNTFIFKNFSNAIIQNTKQANFLNINTTNLKDLISYSKHLCKHITPIKSSQIFYDNNKYILSLQLSEQLKNDVISDSSKFLLNSFPNIQLEVSNNDLTSNINKQNQVNILGAGQNINRVISLQLGRNSDISTIHEFSKFLEQVNNKYLSIS